MDYLRTLGSAAVSSLVQKSGLNLPFSLGPKASTHDASSIWTLYDATKRDDGSPVSVFEFDTTVPGKKTLLPLAKNALRKLRVTRHPDVLKFMDAVETDTTIYIMTERVRPLVSELPTWYSKGAQEKQDWLLWGLHRISTALAFVNDPCNSTHGSIRAGSIFLSTSGEWKLGGFELLSSPTDEAAVLYTFGGLMPDANHIAPPEVRKGGWTALKEGPPAAADAYALAILIHTLFNPDAGPPPTTQPPHQPPQPSSRGAIPVSVFPSFKKLLTPNPKPRLPVKTFLDTGLAESLGEGGGFFKENRLIKICEGLESFGLMADGERTALLRTIKDVSHSLPETFATHLVLPSLLTALSHTTMSSSAAAVLPLVIQLGNSVPPTEYPKTVLEPVVKLFASPDRGTRMALLDSLPDFAEKLDKKTVSEKIWPHLQSGFTDTVAILREATVKAIGVLTTKFTDRILNNDLLRFLARLQTDTEPSIRTNTVILLARLAPLLSQTTKSKVLAPAFARALRDDFPAARVAGVRAFVACAASFPPEEIANRVVGLVASAVIDKEKPVRDEAFKAVAMFIDRLEKHAATLPETALDDGAPNPLAGLSPPNGQATLTSSAGALAGWAISSLGKKLAPGELQSSISPGAAPPIIPSATKPAIGLNGVVAGPSSSKPRGMQLSATKTTVRNGLPAELAEEAAAKTWGSGDLMDVNADEDDWSAFESAPDVVISTASLGFDTLSSHDDDDPWGSLDGPSPAASPPPPESAPLARNLPSLSRITSARSPALSAAPSTRSTPLPTPISSPPAELRTPSPVQAAVSTAGMTKEEKAAEMARRKEERKQRIAQLKESKGRAKS
ncbi:ARM repeat-containing protein [Auriscalpium vulgare]|uniref:ARM repeat-containing protein n=1 Tax=Auriscalpium vulgare TaxID=40419 RepID=A0ACB8RI51_9AGAM|nr:ARM repeat-containing protein [Auriscalpium vulgare]